MRRVSAVGIMAELERVNTRWVSLGAGERRRAYAHLRGASELDRPRRKERQADYRAYRPWWRDRPEARVEAGAGLLDRRVLRYGRHLHSPRRRSHERPPARDRLVGQRAINHASSLRRAGDVGHTPEARLSPPTSEDTPSRGHLDE